MCGIAGIYHCPKPMGEAEKIVRLMGKTLVHRGPDDESYYFDGDLGVAFRRLSIIDVSGGRQPAKNETQDIICFMNGEILNYVELREDLLKKGHKFSTDHSDTEVIPHLYEEHGKDFVRYLVGMFAIVLWDTKNKLLLLVRDRFGIKPLFYASTQGSVVFGSEIKPLLVSGLVKREVNFSARDMAFHANFALPPQTMIKNVMALEPGYMLLVTEDRVHKERYYHLSDVVKKKEESKLLHIEEEIYHEIDSAMKMWMRSDVPLGVSQSGGIDSSILMHHASHYADEVVSITVDFQAERYFPDEVRFAKIMAEAIHANHKIITVGSAGVLNCLPAAMWAADNINMAPAYLNHFLVAQEARNYVKVLLSGAGGDELFFGYPWYVFQPAEKFFYALPSFCKTLALFLLRPFSLLNDTSRVLYEWLYAWNDFPNTYPRKHINRTRMLYPHQVRKIFRSDYDGSAAEGYYTAYLREAFNGDVLNALTYVDMFTLIAAHQMAQSDYAGMANSIENRPPFLDHRLVELVLSVPSHFKSGHPMEKKYLLKQAYKKHIPSEILYGKKVGFGSPLHAWVDDRFKKVAKKIITSSSPALEDMNQEYVLSFVEHCDKNWKHAELVYGVMSYATWHKMHIEESRTIMPGVTMEELWDV